jgi:hypothetical protein
LTVAQTAAESYVHIVVGAQSIIRRLTVNKEPGPHNEVWSDEGSIGFGDRAIHDQADPQVKAILTPTQYGQWKEIRKQELEQIKEGGGH